ncbi:MAG: D-alanine--D-alanine ligase [bacterium]
MTSLPKNLKIGVVRGGPSAEYEVSLKSGANVLKHLSETHRPIDIFISKDGKWHINGLERKPERILKNVDVVYNALHGAYGEDGGIQALLDHHGVPYTGSNKFASALGMNKFLTKERVKEIGVKTPLYTIVRDGEDVYVRAKDIFKNLPHPVVIKPVDSGSSVGVTIAQTPVEVLEGLQKAMSGGHSAIVEEFIAGREATCGVLDNFRGQKTYALPPVEIFPPIENNFFDYDSKYNGQSREVCPASFRGQDKKEIERISALVHEALGLRHYSRSDFIISPKRGIYFLEVNTLPGLTDECTFPKSLSAVGMSNKDFIHHIISLALS